MPKVLGNDLASTAELRALEVKVELLRKRTVYHHYIIAALVGAILVIAIFK
jgi:uncharacterized membrane protein YeaQ/YmgE (transglycosylase-associated protein family)